MTTRWAASPWICARADRRHGFEAHWRLVMSRLPSMIGYALLLASAACQQAGAWSRSQVPTRRPDIVATYPHDTAAFTQGLVWHDGHLLESTGQYGASTLRRVDLQSGAVVEQTSLDDTYFAEGLALVAEQLVQLTWREGEALLYDLDLQRTGALAYAGEGWGLCHDGTRLVMSDGSATLYFRDASTFDVLGSIDVTLDDEPVRRLNELECVDGHVYANVWMTNWIVVIDPTSGAVVERIDAAGLLTPSEAQSADWLNGIAYVPETKRFLITGKLWPKLFEVRLHDEDDDDDDPDDGTDSSDTSDDDASSSDTADTTDDDVTGTVPSLTGETDGTSDPSGSDAAYVGCACRSRAPSVAPWFWLLAPALAGASRVSRRTPRSGSNAGPAGVWRVNATI